MVIPFLIAGGAVAYAAFSNDDETTVETNTSNEINSNVSIAVTSSMNSKASCNLQNVTQLQGCTMCAGAACHCRELKELPGTTAKDYTNCIVEARKAQSTPSTIKFDLSNKCKIDMDSISNVRDNTKITQDITNELEAQAELQKQAIQMPSGDSSSSSHVENIINVGTDIQKNFEQSCDAVIKTSNKFECKDSNLFADEIGVMLKNDANVFSSCIQNIQSQSDAKHIVDNTITNTAGNKVEDNLISAALLVIAPFLGPVLLAVAVFIVKKSFSGDDEKIETNEKTDTGYFRKIIIFIIFLIGGFLWFYGMDYLYHKYIYM